tara:strand:+ start:3368 stop:4438 length:1071 start_codon:yes stop_codon:yes gene_type:complete
MDAKVAIIGAGWYGCHLGMMLDAMGCDVNIFEKNSDILQEASGNNQFRLHLGFHYARHNRTRIQSRDGYARFTERYPSLSKPIENNLYVVPKYDSLIDFDTYRLIMFSSGIHFQELRRNEWPDNLKDVDGVLKVDEHVLLIQKARDHFKQKLGKRIRLNTKVTSTAQRADKVDVNGESFDFVIDATWGHLTNIDYDCFYEPTLLLYYRYKGEGEYPAITMVDGPLCSIYPTEEENIYTLSSVKHTPLGKFDTSKEAKTRLQQFTNDELNQKIVEMEAHIKQFVPDFNDKFEYVAPQLNIKTKLLGEHDDRSCYVKTQDRVISVFSGKIDTIFFAAQKVCDYLERYVHGELLPEESA